jgi:hypothetical protein
MVCVQNSCVVRYQPEPGSAGRKAPDPADLSLFIELNVSHKLTLDDAAIMPDSERKVRLRAAATTNSCFLSGGAVEVQQLPLDTTWQLGANISTPSITLPEPHLALASHRLQDVPPAVKSCLLHALLHSCSIVNGAMCKCGSYAAPVPDRHLDAQLRRITLPALLKASWPPQSSSTLNRGAQDTLAQNFSSRPYIRWRAPQHNHSTARHV